MWVITLETAHHKAAADDEYGGIPLCCLFLPMRQSLL